VVVRLVDGLGHVLAAPIVAGLGLAVLLVVRIIAPSWTAWGMTVRGRR
jgi:hypothetical protein